jgi:oligopeptidase B
MSLPLAALAAPAPPRVPKRPLRIEQLGRVRTDDYAWLKPANWKEVWRDTSVLDPQIRAWLATENAYADEVLAPTKPLQAAFLAEMTARTAPEQESPPRLDGGFAYLTRFSPGAQYPQRLRRPAPGGPETLLLDAMTLASENPLATASSRRASRGSRPLDERASCTVKRLLR